MIKYSAARRLFIFCQEIRLPSFDSKQNKHSKFTGVKINKDELRHQ